MRRRTNKNKYMRVDDETRGVGCPSGSLGGSSYRSSPLSSTPNFSSPGPTTEQSRQSLRTPKAPGAEKSFTGNSLVKKQMTSSNQRPIDPGQSSSGSVHRTSSRKRKSHEFLVLDEEMMEQEEKRLAERERKDKSKDTKERDVSKRQRGSSQNKGTKAKGTQTKQNEDEEDIVKTRKSKAKDKYGEVTNNLRDKYGALIHPDPHQCSLLELNSKGDCMELSEFEMPQHHGKDKGDPESIGVPNTGEHSPTLMPELWEDGERLYPHEGYEAKVTQKEFDDWVGSYFKKLTNEEKRFLENKGDMKTPFIIPDLGQHYSKTWAEEDGLTTPEYKEPSKSPPPTPKDGSLPPGHSFRPLTARLFALLLPEAQEDPTNTESESANNLSSSQPGPNAYTTTMPGLEELDLVADGPTDERLAQELRYIGFFDKNTTYVWETGKKKRTGDETDEGSEDEIGEEIDDDTDEESEDDTGDGDTDEKTDEKSEDETSEESDGSVGEKPTDEVSIRLKELQGLLKGQCILNIARKTRISGEIERHMVHQELLRSFGSLDSKINDASSTFIKKSLSVVKRFQTMNKRVAPATRRGKRTGFTKKPWPIPESIRKAMKERKLLVRTSEAALRGEILGTLPIKNTFEEMGDLLKKVEEELEASTEQVMVDSNLFKGEGEEWEDEDEGGEGTKRKRKEKDDDYYEEEEKEKGKKEEENEEDEDENDEDENDEDENDEESESWGDDDDDDDYKGCVRGF
ncbi:uncharacterized protein LAJ45_06119 [Morchella importuna]|uniref:uncharacterized protein n=1 Tax=Morchella importuna TaxID=1174673 RepID=UPI001E8E6AA7|nr:uncharacterized protein LAJ45_06119 [Morchella importuna]KAH8149966.1 hypothetical protein LAJ45_06119 [Morchella importuna]